MIGYDEFLFALAHPDRERHDEFRDWIGGAFDPAQFAADKVAKRMQRGRPDWRRML